MVIRFDTENGNGFHIPTALYNAAGIIPHPLEMIAAPVLPWYQRAVAKIPANVRSIIPGPLYHMPPVIHVRKSTVG